MDLAALLYETFPVSSDVFSLELVPESINPDTGEVNGGIDDTRGHLRATFRTVTWDVDGEARSIRDVKEQDVFLLAEDYRDDPRLPAYVEGWAAALRFIFERHAELTAAGALPQQARDALDWCMPSDLVHPGVLALKRPQTAEDFTEALLSSKKRLGRFIP